MLNTIVFKFIITIIIFAIATPFWSLYALIVDYKQFKIILEMWQEIIDFDSWK